MSNLRYPKIVFDRLKSLDIAKRDKNATNWYTQVKELFANLGVANFWKDEDLGCVVQNIDRIEEQARNFLRDEDMAKVRQSCSLILYPSIIIGQHPQSYLQFNSHYKISILAQIRLANFYNFRVITKNSNKLELNSQYCPTCHTPANESLIHFLADCSSYDDIWTDIFGYRDRTKEVWMSMIANPKVNDFKNMTKFIHCAFELRNKILDL